MNTWKQILLLLVLALCCLVSAGLHLAVAAAEGGWPDPVAWMQASDPLQQFSQWLATTPLLQTGVLLLAGLTLPVAGLMTQTLLRNPLAGPSVLGLSSGAWVAAVLLPAAAGSSAALITDCWLQALSATGGALLVLLLLRGISKRISGSSPLLVAGMVTALWISSLGLLLLQMLYPGATPSFLNGLVGAPAPVTWNQFATCAILNVAGLLTVLFLQKPLNAVLLGEAYARSMGMSVALCRVFAVSAVSLLVGTTTAFAGPIALVGLAAPHFARRLLRTADHRMLVPGSMLTGSTLLLLTDAAANWPGLTHVLPLNLLLILVFSPVILQILFKHKNIRTYAR